MRFTDADVGRKVVYRAPHVPTSETGDEGVITSVTARWVFVRYGSDVGSKATPLELLDLVGRVDREP